MDALQVAKDQVVYVQACGYFEHILFQVIWVVLNQGCRLLLSQMGQHSEAGPVRLLLLLSLGLVKHIYNFPL